MRIGAGMRLFASRSVGDTLTFSLTTEQGDPYIMGMWDNPHFVMSITSRRYTSAERYAKSWWVDLGDRLKFENRTIRTLVEDEIANGAPKSDFVYDGVVKIIHENGDRSYFYHSAGIGWLTYIFEPISIVFTSQFATEWIEQEYTWDARIVAGEPPVVTNPMLIDDQGNIVTVVQIIPPSAMLVSSDIRGGR